MLFSYIWSSSRARFKNRRRRNAPPRRGPGRPLVSTDAETRSLRGLADLLVAIDAVHREPDIGECGAVHVLLPCFLDQLVGQALELGGEDDVLADIRDRRDLPLGGLAELLQRLGVL